MRLRGWTVDRLLTESGIRVSRCSLNRKLRGKQMLRASEIEALASALGVTIAWASVTERKRRAS
jgi:transcriptional regulator with XRE-family HTH domain